jgi:hypothetical protein
LPRCLDFCPQFGEDRHGRTSSGRRLRMAS